MRRALWTGRREEENVYRTEATELAAHLPQLGVTTTHSFDTRDGRIQPIEYTIFHKTIRLQIAQRQGRTTQRNVHCIASRRAARLQRGQRGQQHSTTVVPTSPFHILLNCVHSNPRCWVPGPEAPSPRAEHATRAHTASGSKHRARWPRWLRGRTGRGRGGGRLAGGSSGRTAAVGVDGID